MVRSIAFATLVIFLILAGYQILPGSHEPFADATDLRLVKQGKRVYETNCAACHGTQLEGKRGWNTNASLPPLAPPQDETGHTWQHSDRDIFQIVIYGIKDRAGGALNMPAFANQLSNTEITSAIAFIKSRWPPAVRGSQSLLNPNFRGMPPEMADTAVFPPACVPGQAHQSQ